MKKAFLRVAVRVGAAAAAQAKGDRHTSAGCGWGTMLFESKTTKLHLILAATTNGTSGNQTFGITSETGGCTSDAKWVSNDKKVEAYADVNFERLSKEMAQGGGEYLSGLAALIGVESDAQRKAFYALTQKSY